MAKEPKQDTTDDTGSVKSYDAPERTGPGIGGMSVGRIVTIVVALVLIALLLNWIF